MSIDLHESVSTGQQVAKRARRRARNTVEAARDVDLHGTAQAAKKVAKHTAKRAARQTAAAAHHASRRTKKKASSRAIRLVAVALVAGAAVGVAITVAKRMRAARQPVDVAPDPFGSVVTESDREMANHALS